MIDRLVVQILPPDSDSFLLAHFDERIRILSLARIQPQNWPFGVDLSARVLLDFDKQWRLAGLDLMIPPSNWQEAELNLPTPTREGTLALNAMPMQRISCPLPVEALKQEGRLLLRWGPAEALESVRLSPQTTALLAGSLWVGMLIENF